MYRHTYQCVASFNERVHVANKLMFKIFGLARYVSRRKDRRKYRGMVMYFIKEYNGQEQKDIMRLNAFIHDLHKVDRTMEIFYFKNEGDEFLESKKHLKNIVNGAPQLKTIHSFL